MTSAACGAAHASRREDNETFCSFVGGGYKDEHEGETPISILFSFPHFLGCSKALSKIKSFVKVMRESTGGGTPAAVNY